MPLGESHTGTEALRTGEIIRNTDSWTMAEFLGQIGMLPGPEAAADAGPRSQRRR